MKKLMTVLSSVALACSLHAASAMWGFSSSDIMDSSGNYIDGGTAFLFLGTVTASGSAFDTSAATQLATGGQNAAYNYGETDAAVSLTGLASDTAGQTYTLILLEKSGVSSLSGYDGNYVLVTGSSDRGTDPMSGETWAIMTDDTAFGASDWQTMTAGGGGGGGGGGVPEPTSGLLLALGGAMLALRRKRA